MKTRISKAYRGNQHFGWKKTIGGRSWFLGSGTSPSAEAKAIALAEIVEAKWLLAKAAGESELSQTDFDASKELLEKRPRWASARESGLWLEAAVEPQPASMTRMEQPTVAVLPSTSTTTSRISAEGGIVGGEGMPRRWLFASLDEFAATVMKELKPDGSNGDHVLNTCERVRRAREAVADMPLDVLNRKRLDEWLLAIRAMPSKHSGAPLNAVTIRNLTGGVRVALKQLISWDWWTPPPLWEEAFKRYTVKKLQTPADRKKKRRRPPAHTVVEKRILWHLAVPFGKAMMALADWAGHSQKEISTLTFDDILDIDGELFVERDRNKTGVHGRWWIPPEAAIWIQRVIARTPRDRQRNPNGFAFLTPRNLPLVHRSDAKKRAKSDYVGGNVWPTLLRAAKPYGVRHISFKYMRKGTAQLIRDRWGKEVSAAFLAHTEEDVQEEHYTRPNLQNVIDALRGLHPLIKEMYEPIKAGDWHDLAERVRRENGLPLAIDSTEAA